MSNANASSLTGPRLLVPGGALLLLITSFLPWFHASAGGLSVTQNGWHNFGPVVFIFAILLLAFEGVRLAGVLPMDTAKADLAGLALAGATVVFGVIFVILRFAGAGDPPEMFGLSANPGWGMYLGIVALVAIAVGAWLAFNSGDARAAMRDLQAQAQNRRGAAPPPPPPPAV